MGGRGGLRSFRSGATVATISCHAPYGKAYRDPRDMAQGDADAALSSERSENSTRPYLVKGATGLHDRAPGKDGLRHLLLHFRQVAQGGDPLEAGKQEPGPLRECVNDGINYSMQEK